MLGWQPRYSVDELAKEMVESDIAHFQRQILLQNAGYRTLNNFE
jgi:GDPmannose 4,6-dehydratase